MEQESKYKNIAIIGCGAAGGMVSVLLAKNPCLQITAFDTKEPFSTLLPTGGGRCNITYDEPDIKDFVKNYPRGEKFLLSVFSKFDQKQTRKLFSDLGIKTYVQPDKRVFPVSDSAAKTIAVLRKHLETSNFTYKKERVTSLKKDGVLFSVSSEKDVYYFDAVIIAAGGRNSCGSIKKDDIRAVSEENNTKYNYGGIFGLLQNMGHNIVELKPSLTSFDIKEKNFYKLSGLSFKNTVINITHGAKKFPEAAGDILFAHKSITGPAIFKVSALTAYENFNSQLPLNLKIKLIENSKEEIEKEISQNSRKTVRNVFSKFVPESYISEILERNAIDGTKQAAQLKKIEKEVILKSLFELNLNAISRIKDSEIVTAGGVDLNEVNSKTMESKLIEGLFFAGEVLNIDGFTGGFNLQNAWSSAYIVSTNFN